MAFQHQLEETESQVNHASFHPRNHHLEPRLPKINGEHGRNAAQLGNRDAAADDGDPEPLQGLQREQEGEKSASILIFNMCNGV